MTVPNSSTTRHVFSEWRAGIPYGLQDKWFWTVMVVCMICYFPSLFWTLGLDQNIFAEIGALLRKGWTPYRDVWDVKPPNIYYTFALFESLLGNRDIAVRAADYISAMGSCAVVYLFCPEIGGTSVGDERQLRLPGLVASILLALTFLSLGLADTAQTESFALFWVLLAGGMVVSKPMTTPRAVLAGICIAIAAQYKTTNAIFLLPILMEIALRNDRQNGSSSVWNKILRCCTGFVAWTVLQLGILGLEGGLPAYLRIAGRVFLHHPGEVSSLGVGGMLHAVWALVDIWLVVIAAAIVLAGILRNSAFFREARLPLFYLATGLLIVVIQNKGWGYHYVIVLAGLIPLCGMSAVLIYRTMFQRYRAMAVVLTFGIIVATLCFTPSAHRRYNYTLEAGLSYASHEEYLLTLGAPQSLYYPPGTAVLSTYFMTHTSLADKIFIFGEEPGAYWQSGRLPATPYIYTLLVTSGVVSAMELRGLCDTLAASLPKWMVIERFDTTSFRQRPETSESLVAHDPLFAPLKTLIAQRYTIADTVSDNFMVFKRR